METWERIVVIFNYFQEITELDNGLLFLNTSKGKIVDSTPVGKEFDYLRHEGFVTYTIDPKYNIPLKEINFDWLFETSVQLGPESKAARSKFLLL